MVRKEFNFIIYHHQLYFRVRLFVLHAVQLGFIYCQLFGSLWDFVYFYFCLSYPYLNVLPKKKKETREFQFKFKTSSSTLSDNLQADDDDDDDDGDGDENLSHPINLSFGFYVQKHVLLLSININNNLIKCTYKYMYECVIYHIRYSYKFIC